MISKLKLYYSFSIAVLFIFSACQKENLISNDTSILAFHYTDAIGQSQQAAIHGDSIFVYWTPLQEVMGTITPKISIHSSASILPISGESILLQTGQKYTVTAENGETKTYFLSLKINQPYPYISNIQTLTTAHGKKLWQNHQKLRLSGDFLKIENEETKVWGISPTNEKIEVEILSNSGAIMELKAPEKGSYIIEIEIGKRKIQLPDQIEVIDQVTLPSITRPTAATKINLKRGDTYTFSGVLTNTITEVTIGDYVFQNALEIVGSDSNSITVRIPNDFAFGEYTLLYAVYQPGTYYSEGRALLFLNATRAIVVTE